MIGFSTANTFSIENENAFHTIQIIKEEKLDSAFQAVIEAEEEAVLNSMVAADSVTGWRGEIRQSIRPFLDKYLNQ